MTRILVVFFSLLIVGSVSAQGNEDRIIIWGGDPTCGYRGKGFTAADDISCAAMDTPRGVVSVVTRNGFSLAVSFSEDKRYLIVATFLKNGTPAPIDFDTDRWGAAHFRTKEDFFTGKKPFLAETAIPSRDIVRGVRSGVNLDNSIDVFMASISKSSEVKEIRRQDGTRVKKVVIIDDPDAKVGAEDRNDSRSRAADDGLAKIRKTALTQKWVSPESDAKGLVYFRRMKKAGMVVFSFKIEDAIYVFRLPRNRG
ncbi:MAG: hypothetical protein ABI999_00840 [Acidobacteriota bacterium]